MSLAGMSKILKMNKTTLFRFLNSLTDLNVLEKKNGQYFLGIRLFKLGNKVPVKEFIIDKIHPLLESLVNEVNETVNLGVLAHNRVLYLDKIESNHNLQIHTFIGSYAPIYCSALGKAILSILDESAREKVITLLELTKKTANTIDDPEKLKIHVSQVSKCGYSTDGEEFEDGLNCVAVPLYLPDMKFYGAISFSGSSARFTHRYMDELAGKLKLIVKQIKKIMIMEEKHG